MAIQGQSLTRVDSVGNGDLLPIWPSADADWRGVALSVLKEYMTDGITAADDKVTQYAAPSATGFSVQILDGARWLVLTPSASYAAGTIVLPNVAGVVDKQELLVNCTQGVSTLVVSGNGATVTGAPTALSANGFFRMRFDALASVWYRVG
jgi:hypothetical protein